MISLLSKYRTQIMGVAILWIMLYHMPYLNGLAGQIIGSAILIGFCGVDIFFFLSSFGLYYSLHKKQRIGDFYKKRFARIIPAYWLALIVFGFLKSLSFDDIIKEMSMLGMFFPFLDWQMFDWYIPAQLFFYIISPIIIFNTGRCQKMMGAVIIVSFVIYYLSALLLIEQSWNRNILYLIARIPVFVLGAVFAKMSFEKKEISRNAETIAYIIMFIAILALFLIKTRFPDEYIVLFGLNHFPFLFAVPGFIFLLIRIFKILPNIILSVFGWLGKYSLELYLIHWNLYSFRHTVPDYWGISEIGFLFICFIMSFPLAYLFSKLTVRIKNFIV